MPPTQPRIRAVCKEPIFDFVPLNEYDLLLAPGNNGQVSAYNANRHHVNAHYCVFHSFKQIEEHFDIISSQNLQAL
jgi:hypothetical protein